MKCVSIYISRDRHYTSDEAAKAIAVMGLMYPPRVERAMISQQAPASSTSLRRGFSTEDATLLVLSRRHRANFFSDLILRWTRDQLVQICPLIEVSIAIRWVKISYTERYTLTGEYNASWSGFCLIYHDNLVLGQVSVLRRSWERLSAESYSIAPA